MDRQSDNWKRYPLLVIGDAGLPLPGALDLPLSAVGTAGTLPINEFYLLLALPAPQVPAALARLVESGLPMEQVIALLPPECGLPEEFLPWAGTIWKTESESAEEFRTRLLGKLEFQRRKKLNVALQEMHDSGMARRLSEAELTRALDCTRITHALACAYALPPNAHSAVLRACREPAPTSNGPWRPDFHADRLIVLSAYLFLDSQARGVSFRDQLKERCSALPFRARSELLHHIETGLGFLLGGKSHAA